MSIQVVCYPISDLGPNDGARTGAATAFGCLAQNPQDGDLTRIHYTSAGQQNVCGVDWSPVPADAHIVSIVVRWAEAGTISDAASASAGLRDILTGNNNYGPGRSLPSQMYASFDETFTVNPESGAPWLHSMLASTALAHLQGFMPFEVQYPRLTALVALVNYDPAPVHDQASAASLGDSGAASGSGVQAGAEDLAPSASLRSLAPESTAIGQSQAGAAMGQAWAASAIRRSITGAGTSIAGCTAAASSLAPSGAPSSLGPTASATWLQPKIGGAA